MLAAKIKDAQQKLAALDSKSEERSAVESELQSLELSNPEVALLTVVAGRAAEAEPNSYEAWKWGRLAEEMERVNSAAEVLLLSEDDLRDASNLAKYHDLVSAGVFSDSAKSENDAASRLRSRALSELQYWTLRGNRKAEASLLNAVTLYSGTWVSSTADDLLRQAWGMHADATVNSLMNRAREALKVGDASTALKAFRAAGERAAQVDQGRTYPEALRWVGLTLDRALGHLDASQRAFERALAASPNNYVLLLDLGKLHIKKQRQAAAAAATKTDASDTATIAKWLAGVADATPSLLHPDAIKAEQYFERAVQLNPCLQADVDLIYHPPQS